MLSVALSVPWDSLLISIPDQSHGIMLSVGNVTGRSVFSLTRRLPSRDDPSTNHIVGGLSMKKSLMSISLPRLKRMLIIEPLLWLTEYPVDVILRVNSSLKSSFPTEKVNSDVSSNEVNLMSGSISAIS